MQLDQQALLAKWSATNKREMPALAGTGKAGSYDSQGVDCPFVFRHNDRFYMMHVGFDGIGYQTALAVSDNLLEWRHEAVILPRLEGSDRWDRIGAAGSWILLASNDVREVPTLRKRDGRYWMIYHSYPGEGYEAGGAVMGLAWTADESLRTWNRLEQPIFTYKNGGDWEKEGLYKCCMLEHEGKYWMFYNAKGSSVWPWKEETGIATSADLLHWERYDGNPIMPYKEGTFYSQFYSDPCIRYDGERWLNFGFGLDGAHAQGLLAVSEDLLHWVTLDKPLLPHGLAGELDEIHAHKSSVVFWNGAVYHFYCACRPWREGDPTRVEVFEGQDEFRCIALATAGGE
ncbi:hypothetical protein [Cohnella mopanensis]|uniref:hypothetical protein n=1 Tax=Cohnella mopanensis TaxID=2911966 RepID=UPI001EF8B580|nr:hypothetical protein [Cohnella mopanensis]